MVEICTRLKPIADFDIIVGQIVDGGRLSRACYAHDSNECVCRLANMSATSLVVFWVEAISYDKPLLFVLFLLILVLVIITFAVMMLVLVLIGLWPLAWCAV